MSDARSAYIAGRSGGSRPKDTGGPTSTSSERQRTQDAYDAGKAERERAQRAAITKKQGVDAKGGLTPEELQQARNIASGKGGIDTFKDPYDVLTRQQEIAAGFPKTGIEKLAETTGVKVPNLTLQGLGVGAKTLQALLDKIFKPEAKDFNNPQFLAVLKREIDAGRVNKDMFVSNYKSLIDEAYKGFDSGATMGLDSDEILDFQLDQASNLAQEGILGADSQRMNFPAEFYVGKNMPSSTRDLVDLANIAVTPEMQGANPELAKMIFDARMELDRMGKDRSGNAQSGIMAASPALPGISVPAGGITITPRPGPITTNPVLTPVPVGGVAPTTTGITPFNINQFYASLPQYTQSGVMAPTNLSRFTDALRMFPGATV